MIEWYVEFRGPGPTDEIGTLVAAASADDAIPLARARVQSEWDGPDGHMLHDEGEPAYSFAAWRVSKCVPWVR